MLLELDEDVEEDEDEEEELLELEELELDELDELLELQLDSLVFDSHVLDELDILRFLRSLF